MLYRFTGVFFFFFSFFLFFLFSFLGNAGKSGISSGEIVAIAVPIAVALLLFIVGICFLSKRARKKNGFVPDRKSKDIIHVSRDFLFFFQYSHVCGFYLIHISFGFIAANDMTTVESLQYNFSTIEAATNKFSTDKKLGEGGFGEVYKVPSLYIFVSSS